MADCAYVILSGSVGVYVTTVKKKFSQVRVKTRHMCDIGAKQLFGELSLLFDGGRSGTIKTAEHTLVIVIPREAFLKYMKSVMLSKMSSTINYFR